MNASENFLKAKDVLDARTGSQTLVVVAPVPVVRMHHHVGVGVPQRADATPVVGVPLRDDDRGCQALRGDRMPSLRRGASNTNPVFTSTRPASVMTA